MEDSNMSEATASSSVMPPPMAASRQPQRRPKVYTREEWDAQKANIEQLYQVEKKPLPEVIHVLEEDFGFYATERQYKRRIKDWGLEKNLKEHEMKAVIRKRQQRAAQGKESVILFKGRQVKTSKIERAQKRYADFSSFIAPQFSPSASTPSDVVCYTPKDAAISESPTRSKSVPEVSHQMQAGIYWPPSPLPFQDQLNQPSQSGQSTTHTIPATPMTPGTPFITDILSLDTADFVGKSPAPFPSTPGPPGDVSFNADSLSVNDSAYFMGNNLDGILSDGHTFLSTGWSSDDIDTDLALMDIRPDVITETFDSQLNLSTHVAPPQCRRYKEEEEERLNQELHGLETENGREHPSTIDSRLDLAAVFVAQGRYRAAEAFYRRALYISHKKSGSNDEKTLIATEGLLRSLAYQGRTSLVLTHYRSLRRRAIMVLGREHNTTIEISLDMGAILSRSGIFDEAALLAREVLQVCLKKGKGMRVLQMFCMQCLGLSLLNLGRLEEAERVLEEVYELYEMSSIDQVWKCKVELYFAQLYYLQGRHEDSEKICKEVLAVQESLIGPEHPDTLLSVECLAENLRVTKRYEESQKLMLEVWEKRTKVLGPNHPDTQKAQVNYVSLSCLVNS